LRFGRNYFDTLNAKAALLPLKSKERNRDIPYMVSGTIPMLLEEHFRDKR
jgi:methionine synthase I (cobalamin-dependent)